MKCQHVKLINVTPHSFVPELNQDLDSDCYVSTLLSLIYKEELHLNNLIFLVNSEKYYSQFYSRNDWSRFPVDFFKKVLRNENFLPLDLTFPKSEDELVSNLDDRVTGTICSRNYFEGSSNHLRLTHSHLIEKKEKLDTWVKCKPREQIEISYEKLFQVLDNFLRFSKYLEIHDQYLIPWRNKNYRGVYKVFSKIAEYRSSKEVTINRSVYESKKDSNGNPIPLSRKDFKSEAEEYNEYFTEKLPGINNLTIKVKFWNRLHERYIFSKFAAFSLGKGLSEELNKQDSHCCTPISKKLYSDLISEFPANGKNSRLRKLEGGEWEVFPSVNKTINYQ